ncbi:putative reverse transcriptase domain-containing protein [Tanacetum coccineum]
MNRGFLDSGGRNNNHRKKTNAVIDIGTSVVTEPDRMMNDANPRVDASAAMKDVSSSVVVSSYANVTGKPSGKKLNIRTLFTPGGKRVAYPVVADYVRNTWGKYGRVRSMFSSSTGLFSFQFSSMDGLDAILKNGQWFIRNNPFILKKWHPDENLLKEDVSTIPVWVKLYGVPVTAFSDDGLSVIATKLGTPLMLNSYTADMCIQSWGRSSYARVMIELRADVELKDNIVVAMPIIKGDDYYTCNNRVEYEWKPLRCACCKVFGHVHEECPKNIGAGATKNLKKTSQTPKGIRVGQKMGFKPRKVFQPVSKKSTANTCGKKMNNSVSTKEVSKSNPFCWVFITINHLKHEYTAKDQHV